MFPGAVFAGVNGTTLIVAPPAVLQEGVTETPAKFGDKVIVSRTALGVGTPTVLVGEMDAL